MSITIPEPWLMLLVFVVFLLTMFLLNTWLFKPLLGFMDEREKSLQTDIQSINNSDLEIKNITIEIQAILEKARIEANNITEKAIQEAKADYEAKITKKQSELNTKIESYRANLIEQKESLRSELLTHMPEFEFALKTKIEQI